MDKLSYQYQREKIIQFPSRSQKRDGSQSVVNDLNARLIFFPKPSLSSVNLSVTNQLFIFNNSSLHSLCPIQLENNLFFFTSSPHVIHPSWRCYWARNLPRYPIKERPTTEQEQD